jgi:hypothetical protein
MVHISDRWGGGDGLSRADGLQFAFFNGVGAPSSGGLPVSADLW